MISAIALKSAPAASARWWDREDHGKLQKSPESKNMRIPSKVILILIILVMLVMNVKMKIVKEVGLALSVLEQSIHRLSAPTTKDHVMDSLAMLLVFVLWEELEVIVH